MTRTPPTDCEHYKRNLFITLLTVIIPLFNFEVILIFNRNLKDVEVMIHCVNLDGSVILTLFHRQIESISSTPWRLS